MNINNIKTIIRQKGLLIAFILGGAMLTPFFSGCTDELRYEGISDYDGEEICTAVSLSVLPIQSENPQSRAIEYITATENETKIHDFWLIEYNEEGVRIGLPRYYTEDEDGELPKDIRILVPRRTSDKYTCVLIANSNEPNLFNADNRSKFSTINDLRKFEMSTHNHEHVFDPVNNKYLLMSGWTTITTDPATHKLSFELVRNVCKVNVKLLDFPDDLLVYKYFQWRDVPLGKVFPHGTVNYIQSEDRDWREHHDNDTTQFRLTRADLEEGIDFYLPCNVWLPLPEGTEMPGGATGESNVKELSTHFVIVAREFEGTSVDENGETHILESEEQYEFSLYPSRIRRSNSISSPIIRTRWRLPSEA